MTTLLGGFRVQATIGQQETMRNQIAEHTLALPRAYASSDPE